MRHIFAFFHPLSYRIQYISHRVPHIISQLFNGECIMTLRPSGCPCHHLINDEFSTNLSQSRALYRVKHHLKQNVESSKGYYHI